MNNDRDPITPDDAVSPDEARVQDGAVAPDDAISPDDAVSLDGARVQDGAVSPGEAVSPDDAVARDDAISPDGAVAPDDAVSPDETGADQVAAGVLGRAAALQDGASVGQEAIVDLDASWDQLDAANLAAGDPSLAPADLSASLTQSTSHRIATDTRGRTLSEADFKSLSRRSLLTGIVGAAAGFIGWRTVQGRPVDRRIPDVLRQGHKANEAIWRGLFRDGAEAPTFDYSESSMMRINGRHGIRDDLDLDRWELRIVGRDGEQIGTHQLEDLRAMQQTELTVEHKCVEGWAHIVTWGGVRFSEFVDRYYPDEANAKFVGLSTPDGDYNVGLDMPSMLHSQTLLALDLQREPLTEGHGAPVRLATPLKYGIKQIKRIGTIQFSDTQPENDYWTERGYDWYAAL